MIILPAIDIIDGKPVRLYQGDYSKKEIVADDIFETALSFERDGAEFLHLVDLDGARKGSRVNHELVIKLTQTLTVPVELGGGIRDFETIKHLIDNGVARVILGTAAVEDEKMLKKAVDTYGSKIAVGIDVREGRVSTRGWLENSKANYLDFAKHMESIGVKNIIVTDISRDGTLKGPNVEMLKELKKYIHINITASAGVSSIDDIKALSSIDLYGAITGKAVYAGALSLKEAIEISK